MNYPISLISRGRLHFRSFQAPLMVFRANITAKHKHRKDNMTFTFWPFMTQIIPPAPHPALGADMYIFNRKHHTFLSFCRSLYLNVTP